MNILEIINIRLSNPEDSNKLALALNDIRDSPAFASLEVFRDARMESDWFIFLYRTENSGNSGKSPLALRLVDFFRPLGLINHSVLISKAVN